MDTSLFKRLAEAHPHAVISLRAQYRMNYDIMVVCNALVYEQKLYCATPQTASARISIPAMAKLPRPQGEPTPDDRSDWLFSSLNPNNAVVFLDTDLLDPLEPPDSAWEQVTTSPPSSSLENKLEVNLVELLMKGFHTCGFDTKKIGVISPYRAQVSSIRKALMKAFEIDDCEFGTGDGRASPSLRKASFFVDTVDKFQGQDM